MEAPSDTPTRTPPIDRNRELLTQAQEEIFKTVGDVELRAYIWQPPANSTTPALGRPIMACFFSSGWDHGQVSQFAPHCVYFASRGMITVAFEYRVQQKHGTGPLEALEDARDAILWLRLNAEPLGINPHQIVGLGGSGGAHAIASTALLAPLLKRGEVLPDIHPQPNALVLFNPVLDTSKHGFGLDRFPDAASAKQHNLIRAIRKDLPPTIVLHGTADRVVPFAGSNDFVRKARRKKNVARLVEFEGAGHGFFNFNVSYERYEATLMAIDDFLIELGILVSDPETQIGLAGY